MLVMGRGQDSVCISTPQTLPLSQQLLYLATTLQGLVRDLESSSSQGLPAKMEA